MAEISLLARFAANVFWLGRYLERAESVARILDTHETYARDEPDGANAHRVLGLYADSDRFLARYETPDDPSVLTFYVLDRDNPNAIKSAIAAARENARSVRHLISTEMWTHINMVHNQIARLTQRDIRPSNLSRLCGDVKIACQAYEGITEGTLLRGEAWAFYHIGKYIERADQTTRILDMGYDRIADEEGAALKSVHWNVLLRSVSGYHAFRSKHPAQSYPQDVATFLLYDHEFPRAVALCVAQITTRIRDLEDRHGLKRSTPVERARRELEFLLETGLGARVTPRRLHQFIDRLQIRLGEVSVAMERTYFGHG